MTEKIMIRSSDGHPRSGEDSEVRLSNYKWFGDGAPRSGG